MKNLSLIIIGVGTGALLATIVFLLIYTQYSPMEYSIAQIGAFGDAVGGIANPIF